MRKDIPPASSTAREGERAAAEYLERQGFAIVGRNLRLGRGEIDIVARRGDLTCLVEVKARRSTHRGRPDEAVTERKRAQIRRLGALFAARNPGGRFRFDVASVTWDERGAPEVRYFPNAFGMTDPV